MGKNKLKKFKEMEQLPNVFQCAAARLQEDGRLTSVDLTHEVSALRGHWSEQVFHNDHPIVLELGCGHGDYTVGLARRTPEKNFIGVDIKGARIWHGAREAYDEGLSNVAFLRTNIEMVTSFFAEGEISEIWITFPDPQMKKATKRLTSTYFMARYQQLMQEGGLIHLKTDSPFLSTYTREMVRINDYPVVIDSPDLYAEGEGAERGQLLTEAKALQTHYERQWLDRGLTIKYICWQLIRKEQWTEPEIEIEKDSYRSYGRNYVSTTNH